MMRLLICALIVLGGCSPRDNSADAYLSRFDKAVEQICTDSRDTEALSEKADNTSADAFHKLGDLKDEAEARHHAAEAAAALKSTYEDDTCKPYLSASSEPPQ